MTGFIVLFFHQIAYTETFIQAAPPPIKDRGSIAIPKEIFPDGKDTVIPIYVPAVVDGSNASIKDDWKTVLELKKQEVDKLATALGGLKILGGDPDKAKQLLNVKTEYKITVQESLQGNHRAIIETSGRDRAVQNIAGSLSRARIFKKGGGSMTGVIFDKNHTDDPYIAYVSLSPEKNAVDITPKIYPRDKVMIKNTFLGIPTTKVMEVKGEELISFLKPFVKSSVDIGLLEKMLSDDNVVSSMEVTYLMDDKGSASFEWLKKIITKSAVKQTTSNVISEHVIPNALDLGLQLIAGIKFPLFGLFWPKVAEAPTIDPSELSLRNAGDISVNVSFTQDISGLYTQTPDFSESQGADWSSAFSGTRTGEGSIPGNFTGSGSGRVEAISGYMASSINSEPFSIATQGEFTASGKAGQPLAGTMRSIFDNTSFESISLKGDVTIYPDGRLDWENIEGDITQGGTSVGTFTGTINQGPTK